MVCAKLTYQSLDHTLWTACFSPLEQLAERVAKPSEFREHISDLVLICSDQIPLWIKSGSERELFAEWAHNPLPQEHLRERLKNHHLSSSDQVVSGDVVPPLRNPIFFRYFFLFFGFSVSGLPGLWTSYNLVAWSILPSGLAWLLGFLVSLASWFFEFLAFWLLGFGFLGFLVFRFLASWPLDFLQPRGLADAPVSE